MPSWPVARKLARRCATLDHPAVDAIIQPSKEDPATPVGLAMTLAEIYAAHPDEYVVLGDLDSDDTMMALRGGVVLCHAATRREALDRAHALHPEQRSFALRYTGRIFLNAASVQQQ